MLKKRKGISTFIATLLLMVLAVSAGVVIYAYTMGYMGGFGGTDTLGAMSLDEANMTEDGVFAYIRNIGKIDLKATTAYVDGVESTVAGNDIIEGEVEQVTITPVTGDPWEAGKTYEIKLIAEDNTQLSFSLKCK